MTRQECLKGVLDKIIDVKSCRVLGKIKEDDPHTVAEILAKSFMDNLEHHQRCIPKSEVLLLVHELCDGVYNKEIEEWQVEL